MSVKAEYHLSDETILMMDKCVRFMATKYLWKEIQANPDIS